MLFKQFNWFSKAFILSITLEGERGTLHLHYGHIFLYPISRFQDCLMWSPPISFGCNLCSHENKADCSELLCVCALARHEGTYNNTTIVWKKRQFAVITTNKRVQSRGKTDNGPFPTRCTGQVLQHGHPSARQDCGLEPGMWTLGIRDWNTCTLFQVLFPGRGSTAHIYGWGGWMTFAQCGVLFACCEQFNKCVCAKRSIPTFTEQLMHP